MSYNNDMTLYQKISLVFLRITAGGLFLYAGLSHLLDKGFSAAGYITHAANFTGFFNWLASPALLPFINQLNIWALTLLGVSLILGIFVRYAAPLGAVLMFLYYIVLPFPFPDAHSFLIDEHIILIGSLLVLAALDSGKIWGLDAKR